LILAGAFQYFYDHQFDSRVLLFGAVASHLETTANLILKAATYKT
jgi:hypothetical protein